MKARAGTFLVGCCSKQQLGIVSQAVWPLWWFLCPIESLFMEWARVNALKLEPSEVCLGGSAVGSPSSIFHSRWRKAKGQAELCRHVRASQLQEVTLRALGTKVSDELEVVLPSQYQMCQRPSSMRSLRRRGRTQVGTYLEVYSKAEARTPSYSLTTQVWSLDQRWHVTWELTEKQNLRLHISWIRICTLTGSPSDSYVL